jgi:hypothetical protein
MAFTIFAAVLLERRAVTLQALSIAAILVCYFGRKLF